MTCICCRLNVYFKTYCPHTVLPFLAGSSVAGRGIQGGYIRCTVSLVSIDETLLIGDAVVP
jgi:hypothetical protein